MGVKNNWNLKILNNCHKNFEGGGSCANFLPLKSRAKKIGISNPHNDFWAEGRLTPLKN